MISEAEKYLRQPDLRSAQAGVLRDKIFVNLKP